MTTTTTSRSSSPSPVKEVSFSLPQPSSSYTWQTFTLINPEVCYLDAFLSENDLNNLDLPSLDLSDFANLSTSKLAIGNLNDMIKDQCSRLLKYGNIAKAHHVDSRSDNDSEDMANKYDLDDSFIDDTEIDQGLRNMELFQGGYRDYFCHQGGLERLLGCEDYKLRLKELETIRTFSAEDEKVYMKKAKQRKQKKKTGKKMKEKTQNSHVLMEGLFEMSEKKEKKSLGKNSGRKSMSKKKFDSLKKKNEVAFANHPTLSKFKDK